MTGGELKSGFDVIKGTFSIVPRIWRSVSNWLVLRASGVPRRAVTITPHQELRPVWCIVPDEREPTMFARCDWYIHNFTSVPISMTGTYLGKKAPCPGRIALFVVRGDLLSPATVGPKKTVEAACDFFITPPLFQAGEDFKSDVKLVDQYGNTYTHPVTFVFDPTLKFASAKSFQKVTPLLLSKHSASPSTPPII